MDFDKHLYKSHKYMLSLICNVSNIAELQNNTIRRADT